MNYSSRYYFDNVKIITNIFDHNFVMRERRSPFNENIMEILCMEWDSAFEDLLITKSSSGLHQNMLFTILGVRFHTQSHQ